jgi:uncharacterized protein (DUF3820 family)
MNWTDDLIKGKILHKLARHEYFNEKHTAVEHLQKGFPKDIIGRVKELVKELKKEGLLTSKPTSYGEQVSINLEQKEAAMRYVDHFLQNKQP